MSTEKDIKGFVNETGHPANPSELKRSMRSQLIDVNNIRLGKHLGIRYNVPRARVKSITKQTKMLKGMRNVLQGEVEGFLSDGTGYTAKQVEVVQKLFHGENVKGISAAQERAVVAIWKEEMYAKEKEIRDASAAHGRLIRETAVQQMQEAEKVTRDLIHLQRMRLHSNPQRSVCCARIEANH
ncbi:hypothetical protein QFC24_000408 [Naganishia onofrii]|uniref:Uncharacterized protein n=1 Tax=Naganishia onofrii TaxID=1851511 RepID=A0ACC2XXC7_9TREE|nr:hypothetical protein QFC24_000408 [Naganishia onofrii]